MERQLGRQAGKHSLGKEIGNEGEEEMELGSKKTEGKENFNSASCCRCHQEKSLTAHSHYRSFPDWPNTCFFRVQIKTTSTFCTSRLTHVWHMAKKLFSVQHVRIKIYLWLPKILNGNSDKLHRRSTDTKRTDKNCVLRLFD